MAEDNTVFVLQKALLTHQAKVTKDSAAEFLLSHPLYPSKVHTRIADKICGFSSGVDCDGVLSSGASRVFGNINLADAGIIYFTSTLIYVLVVIGTGELWLLAVVSAISVLFPVYSIYYQGFRLRKWCPFCLVVQAALIAEFLILFPLLGSISISLIDVLRLAASLTLVTSVWILYKSYYVNGYRFPREFKLNDIEYFTEAIKSLTTESKRQEACSHCK